MASLRRAEKSPTANKWSEQTPRFGMPIAYALMILVAMCSAIIITVRFVGADGISGRIDASTDPKSYYASHGAE